MKRKGIDWLIPIGPSERLKHVNECLMAVYRQVSLRDDGLVVVCDRSQWEEYAAPPEGLECRLVQPPATKNASAYRNAALHYIKRTYVVFQDSDDISLQYRREKVIEALISSDVVCSGYSIIDGQGVCIGERSLKGSNDTFFFRNNAPLPTLAIRACLLNNLKFNENLPMGEDNELIGRLIKKNVSICRLSVPLIKYRVVTSKHVYRSGFVGVINELRYRTAMAKYANVKQSLFLFVGALICIAVKCLPKALFDSLHRRSHGGRRRES